MLQSYFDPETNDQTTTTQEFNLISSEPAFGKLDWVAGVFYLDTEVDIAITERLDFGFDGTFDPFTVEDIVTFGPADAGFISNSKPERESMSVYGQGTLALTDTTRLIGGLRYTRDEVYSEVTNFYGRGGTDILEIDSNEVTGRIAYEKDFDDVTWATFHTPVALSQVVRTLLTVARASYHPSLCFLPSSRRLLMRTRWA